MRFLAIGECMAEMAPASTDGEFRLGFAGDTFNTAWYLARLCPQFKVAYFTAIGTDEISQNMRSEATSSGIDDSFIQSFDDATLGLYLISLKNGERSFSYWRGQSAARQMFRNKEKLKEAIDVSDLIYFSGISLAILGREQRGTLLKALKEARTRGKIVVFDPNLRPRLWDSCQEMVQVVTQGAEVSDVILPSFEDEAVWFKDATPQATAKRYADAGASTVVVKNGDGQVHYWNEGVTGNIPVQRLSSVVDSTAAGDSFNAEILAGIAEGTWLEQSIQRACALAAIVVQGKGALVSINLDQIDR